MSDEEPKRLGPGPGRPPHALNKISRDIKQAIIDGLVSSDYAKDPDDKNAPGSMARYMQTVANKHPELFFQAVVKLIPKEVRQHLQTDTTIDIHTYRTVEEVKTAMRESGFSQKEIAQIESMLPMPLEPDEEQIKRTP